MALDIYGTRAQLKAIELIPRVNTFLYDTFVQDEGQCEDEKAIYDFKKGVVQMAPFVHEDTGGVLMGRTGYRTNEIEFPTIAPERIVKPSDIKGRAFGEAILGAMTPDQRARKMYVQDMLDMKNAIQRRREWMVRELLLTGTLPIFEYTNEGRSMQATMLADYEFTQFYTPTVPWNQAGADIVDNMKAITDQVTEGLGDLGIIVMAPDVASTMLNNEKYIKLLDIRNIDVGSLRQKYKGQGLRYVGTTPDGIDMYSLSGRFIDDKGVETPYIPSGKMICGDAGIIKQLHGPIYQVEKEGMDADYTWYYKPEVPFRHGSSNGKTILNRLTSRPTYMPYNVDSWVVATVL